MRYPSFVLLAALSFGCASSTSSPSTPTATPFQLTSPTIQEGQSLPLEQVFNGYGCTGGYLSPELTWSHPPEDTRSFALSLRDLDGQNGAVLLHWLVYDIPPTVATLPAGIGVSSQLPQGAKAAPNSFGMPGFAGACPPAGDKAHRYEFTLYALKTDQVELPATDAGAPIEVFSAQEIGHATLRATYSR